MDYRLSKSRYCSGVQCPKMLWMKKYKPECFDDSVMNEGVLNAGNEVGDLAMGLFGPYAEVPYSKDDLGSMLTATRELLERGTPVITEASFSYEGSFCSVDILRNLGGGRVEIYEVKSASHVSPIYEDDVSFQNYVLSALGYRVERVCLVHVNTAYVRHGALDLSQLFAIRDLTDIAKSRYYEVEENIRQFRAYMEQKEEPQRAISENCMSPYMCGFWGHCTEDLPHPNVFDVAGVQMRTKWKHYRNGLVSFPDLRDSGVFSRECARQLDHEVEDLPPYIDADAVRACLSSLRFPLYFLDFETFNPAIPLYEGSRPYQQITFQYSLHYIEREGGPLLHKEFLAYPGEDPRYALAEQLCRDIPMGACTVAYNMTFERTRLKELAELCPALADHLLSIRDNMQDLMVPFKKRQYYARAMQGSYSIKYVLPALFPEDPSLNYHNLEGVHNGAEASDTFRRMAAMSPEELEKTRAQLLSYCGLDTFAMVKLWEKLLEAAGLPFTSYAP